MPLVSRFFVTKNDIIDNLKKIESEIDLAFIKNEHTENSPVLRLHSISDHHDIGVSSNGETTADQYFVIRRNDQMTTGFFLEKGKKVFYPNLDNSFTTNILSLGGVYNDSMIIAGSIGVGEKKEARALYKEIKKYLLKGLKKKDKYHLGEEAIRLHKKGYRLITMSHLENYNQNFVL